MEKIVLKFGGTSLGTIDKIKKSAINTLNSGNASSVILKVFSEAYKNLGLDNNVVINIFGSELNFIHWWMRKCEFSFLYSVEFNSDENRREEVFHLFHNYYRRPLEKLDKEEKGASPLMVEVAEIQTFCAKLQFLVSTVSCSGGFDGGLPEVQGATPVSPLTAPNKTTPTHPYEHTNKLWILNN